MGNFARAQGGTKREGGRKKNDYYPTPPFATYALLHSTYVPRRVIEPAAGRGWMARELADSGREVVASDLFEYKVPLFPVQFGVDFLKSQKLPDVDGLVTNPPYAKGMAQTFIEKAISDGYDTSAFLCRFSLAESEQRLKLFKERPPAEVHVFSGRMSCDEDYFDDPLRGMITFAWWVWREESSADTKLKWIDSKAMYERWKLDVAARGP